MESPAGYYQDRHVVQSTATGSRDPPSRMEFDRRVSPINQNCEISGENGDGTLRFEIQSLVGLHRQFHASSIVESTGGIRNGMVQHSTRRVLNLNLIGDINFL
jgi:hypothetical protein